MLRHPLKLCTALVLAGGLALPVAAQAANHLKDAQAALKKGDLRTAEIELRNAVRDDPQNAALRFDLAEVELRLADPVSAERDVRAAMARGFDPHKTLPVLGEALLRQGRAKDLLKQLKPAGKDMKLDAETDMLRGQAEIQLGDKDAAKASFADAEKADPSDVQALLADARLRLTEHDTAGAKEKIAHALSLEPKSMEALVLKAIMTVQAGDPAGAVKLLDKTIAEQPPALPARVERASIELAQGKMKEAEADVKAVLALTPGNVQALYLHADMLHRQGKNRDADAILHKLEPTFGMVPRGYLLMAAVAQANGQTQIAEENAAKYIARVPGDVAGYETLAQLYLRNHRPDLALQPLNEAVKAGRTSPAIYQMLGQAEMAVRRPDRASAAFAKLLALEPGNVGVVIENARALAASGHADKGQQLVAQAFAKNSKSPQLQDALVSMALATGNVAQAQGALAEVKKVAGDTPVTENLTGAVQLAALDPQAAADTLQKLVQAHPDMVPARLNLARALSLLNRGKEAEAQLQAILDAHPASEPALSILVANYEHRKQGADAIALLEKAHKAEPRNDAVTVKLGAAYLQAKAPDKALALAEADAQPSASVLALKAGAEVALKKYDDARNTFSRLLQLDPRAVGARRQYVGLLVKHGDYEAARNVLTQGMAATPRVYQLELDYALIDLKASGIKKALQTVASLQQQDPTFAPLVAMPGDVYMAADQPGDALKAYQQAFAKAPSDLLVNRIVGAYTRLKQPSKAREVLADWVAKHSTDYAQLLALSELDIAANNYPAARSELATLVKQQPQNAGLLNNLAWVDQKLGDKDAAALARKAYLLGPSPQTADTLGWILTKQGEAAKGVELLRQAVASGDPRIAYHLAVALNDTGQKAEAVKLLDAVAKVPGTFTEKTDAKKLLGQLTKGS